MQKIHSITQLHTMPLGSLGMVKKLTSSGSTRRRMLDLGLTIDTPVEVLMRSPSGDPTAYKIRGAVIALRSDEAAQILIEPVLDRREWHEIPQTTNAEPKMWKNEARENISETKR